ncbi:MAG TPA: hypothetical protein VF791_06575 [Pyrinomonadaceae bacterium]
MKRKNILGSAAVLICAIVVSVVVYVAITNSRTSSAPTQNSRESARSTKKEPLPEDLFVGEVGEASEKKPRSGVIASQESAQSSTNASPTPSRTTSAARSAPDKFSGKWMLDKSRSEGVSPGMNQVMIVTQSGSVINVKTIVSIAEKGEWTVTDAYTLNGQETEFTEQASGIGTVKGRRIARLTNDGNGIEVNERTTTEARGASRELIINRRWMIADDKTLIIEMNIEGPNVSQRHKRVFVKM